MTSPPRSVLVSRYCPQPVNIPTTTTAPSLAPAPASSTSSTTTTSAYRTRSQSRSSLTSVSTRSMARAKMSSALGEVAKNGSVSGAAPRAGAGRVVSGGKRKSDPGDGGEDQRMTKASRFTNENESKQEGEKMTMRMAMWTISSARIAQACQRPSSPVSATTTASPPTTPVRAIQQQTTEPAQIPTPAREILKAGYESSGDRSTTESGKYDTMIPSFILKPPTPPRLSHQSTKPRLRVIEEVPVIPGNSKRSRSPDIHDEAPSKRIGIAITGNPSQDPVSAQSDQIANGNGNGIGNGRSDHAMSYSTRIFETSAQSTSASLGSPAEAQTASTLSCSLTKPRAFTFRADTADPSCPQSSHESAADITSKDDINATEVDHETESRPVKSLPKLSSMGPPSRLPVMTSKPPLVPSASVSSTISTYSAGLPKSRAKPKTQLGVAEHRPRRRQVAGATSVKVKPLVVFDENNSSGGGGGGGSKPEAPVRRKPSYPSSLGSGPLANPRPRLISGPFQPPRSFSSSAAPPSTSTSSQEDVEMGGDPVKQTIRSVSDPSGRPRASLSSRRESLMSDTSKSLAEMSEALAKLRVKRDDPAEPASQSQSQPTRPLTALRPKVPSVLAEVTPSGQTANNHINTIPPVATSSRLSSVHRPRASVAVAGADVTMDDVDRSMAVLMSTDKGEQALRGVVAFVDVRTEDGACAGDIWDAMLRSLGAKVSTLPTLPCFNHILNRDAGC